MINYRINFKVLLAFICKPEGEIGVKSASASWRTFQMRKAD